MHKKWSILTVLTVFISLSLPTYGRGPFNVKELQANKSSWGINPNYSSSINLKTAWQSFKQKKEVVVAVVDTGVDPNHKLLKNNLYTNSGKTIASLYNYGVDFSKGAKNKLRPNDSHGHGTHISGIIRSVFPKVKMVTLKYYNPKATEKENLDSTVAALEYAVSINVDIINYSSGGAGASLDELRVLKKAMQKGILVVAAAGNFGSNIDFNRNHYYPASYQLDNIITVINHDQYLNINSSSNFGKTSADISAPGSKIKSSLPQGRMGILTGTSQSTAFVSGVAALLMAQYPNLNILQIKNIILQSAKKVSGLIEKCKSGGILDATGAIKLAKYITEGQNSKEIANL